jgi:2-polyprenyl-3-methyl-5-hydroxy-6-metoxy-1,4-benzoquinol methylase
MLANGLYRVQNKKQELKYVAINLTPNSESVYTQRPIEQRAQFPVYVAARELAQRYTQTGHILDIGCSDGAATWQIGDEYTVYGVDLSEQAVREAPVNTAGFVGICADMRQLPFSKESIGQIDTVLLLDILEHEEWEDSQRVLEELRTILPADHHLIVSMPIISPLSIETWKSRMGILLSGGERPDMGLYDRTHKILTGQAGHRRLFAEAGYAVEQEFQTNHVEGLTGTWPWQTPEGRNGDFLGRYLQQTEMPRAAKAAALVLGRILSATYFAASDSNSTHMRKAIENLVAFQGVYVLKPIE